MAVKAIDIEGKWQFASITAAKMFYDPILKNTPISQRVTPDEFLSLKALYEAYCAKTNWPLPSPPKEFYPMLEKGRGFATRCFGLIFENGKTERFSLDKALSAVAN